NPSQPRFVVGAHLDSKPNSPGADDNGSAIAALLEIARLLPTLFNASPPCSLELVAFDLEENGMLGGAFHAASCKRENVDLRGMVSLEMLGYCDNTPGSQQLPKPLVGKYPDTGNFIAVVGNQNSDSLIENFAKGLKQVAGLPVETLQVPDNGNTLQATRLSDHSPFWDEGYAALMITDTSFMRNPHYHLMSDTFETLDIHFLTKVTEGSLHAIVKLLG
ncbi:Putative aminopeptidase, partial [hydrothermal vent metagenome]